MKYEVNFLNKDKGFRPDKKVFNSEEEAKSWCFDNLNKFDPDFIKIVED